MSFNYLTDLEGTVSQYITYRWRYSFIIFFFKWPHHSHQYDSLEICHHPCTNPNNPWELPSESRFKRFSVISVTNPKFDNFLVFLTKWRVSVKVCFQCCLLVNLSARSCGKCHQKSYFWNILEKIMITFFNQWGALLAWCTSTPQALSRYTYGMNFKIIHRFVLMLLHS